MHQKERPTIGIMRTLCPESCACAVQLVKMSYSRQHMQTGSYRDNKVGSLGRIAQHRFDAGSDCLLVQSQVLSFLRRTGGHSRSPVKGCHPAKYSPGGV